MDDKEIMVYAMKKMRDENQKLKEAIMYAINSGHLTMALKDHLERVLAENETPNPR
jgi:hypothetical protein